MSSALTLRVPVIAQGRVTGHVEIARAMPLRALPSHLRWLGYRLTTTCRGVLALERLH